MNNSFLSPRLMVGAAVVGIVGAAGMYLYEQIIAEKKRLVLVQEVARLDKQVSTMRSEIEALKDLQKETHLRRLQKQKRPKREAAKKAVPSGDAVAIVNAEQSYASDSEYFTDYQSVIGTDVETENDEFYDVHTDSDEDDTLRDTKHNGHAVLDEDDSEKSAASKTSPRNST